MCKIFFFNPSSVGNPQNHCRFLRKFDRPMPITTQKVVVGIDKVIHGFKQYSPVSEPQRMAIYVMTMKS